ncbi:hypothetical protein TrispH2_011485 [Trichoplax sp. H2]|nr:hypothetical protein TrispH2_011485 [Trichoplax sp. H2]|eukprot:RDD36745.1 hypothetical protein TrispH2_011485 [Trichoplax sp. H2]
MKIAPVDDFEEVKASLEELKNSTSKLNSDLVDIIHYEVENALSKINDKPTDAQSLLINFEQKFDTLIAEMNRINDTSQRVDRRNMAMAQDLDVVEIKISVEQLPAANLSDKSND